MYLHALKKLKTEEKKNKMKNMEKIQVSAARLG